MKMVRQGVDVSKLYSGLFVGLAFLTLTALTVKFFAPDVASNADTVNQTVGPYTMSMSNDDSVSIDITPTESQSIYTATNELSFTNSCDAGATITITTASGSMNGLIRSGLDSLTKEIPATTSSSSLSDSSWGYSVDGGTIYHAVPKLGDTAATVYTSDNSQTTALTVPVIFGIKTDNTLPSGAYMNDVVYTMAPNPGCLVYAVTWDLDGGTAAAGATYPTNLAWGETVDLTGLTPTREGYKFNGWSNGSSTFTGDEADANINSDNAKTVTIKPEWEEEVPDTLYIYKDGDQKTSITGGWVFRNISGGVNNGNAISPTMYMNVTGTAGVIGNTSYTTSNPIDVSNYSKVVIVVTEHAISNPNSGECSSSINAGLSYIDGWKLTSTGTLTHTIVKPADVNSGAFYVSVLGNCYGTSRIRISSIALQK